MLIKFTKAGFATALCLLMAYVVNAQITNPSNYDLRFANAQVNCASDKFCVQLEIKASSDAGDLALGSHTIAFSYVSAAISSPTYLPVSFDTSVVCSGPGGTAYHPFQTTAFSFEETGASALANLTSNLQFYIPGAECPIVSQEWQTMGEICFDIVDETQNPQLQFDSAITAINTSTNVPSPQHGQGVLEAYNNLPVISAGSISLDNQAACNTQSIAVMVENYLLGNPDNGYLGLVISANPDIANAADFAANAPYLAMAQGSSIAIENANNTLPINTPLYVYSYVGEGNEGDVNPNCFAINRSEAFTFDDCLNIGSGNCNVQLEFNTIIGDCSSFPASVCASVSNAALPYTLTLRDMSDSSVVETRTISTPTDVETCFDDLSTYFYILSVTDNDGCSAEQIVAFPVVDPFFGTIINDQQLSTTTGTAVCATIENANPCFPGVVSDYAIAVNPISGTATIDTTTGQLCYTSNSGFVGTDNITIITCPFSFECDSATITIEITAGNNGGGTSNNPDCNSLIVTSTAHNSACDENTGVACLNIQGGTTPYTISGNWNLNADNLLTGEHCFFPIAPNTYNFTVYDLNGCQQQATVVVEDCNDGGNNGGGGTSNGDCASLLATIVSTDTHCDSTNARICITINGGTTPYNISGNWNLNADNLLTGEYCFENLAAQNYNFTVYDINGCQQQLQAEVACYLENPNNGNDCANFSVYANPTMTSCDYNDGSVCINVSNGTAPYSIQGTEGTTLSATNVGNDHCFDNLNGGSYDFVVTDANACSATVNAIVLLPLDCGMLNFIELFEDTATIAFGQTVCIDVLANDNYLVGSLDAVLAPAHGTAAIANNEICYTPNEGYDGNDTFEYIFCNDATCDTAIVNVTIAPDNNNNGGGTSNNSDCNSLIVTATTQNTACNATTGSVCLTINGGTTPYSISGNWGLNADNLLTGEYCFENVGAQTYNFTIYDINGCQRQISATVACGGTGGTTETAPVANNDAATTQGATSINVTANDQTTDNDTFSISNFTQAANGTVVQNGNSFTYTPNNGFVGTDAFTYTICDNDGCNTATVNLTVTANNNTGGNGNNCQNPDNICLGMYPEHIDLCLNFCGIDNASISDWQTIYNCSVVTLNDSCVRYTPLPGFFGNETLEVVACNAQNECDTIVVHLYIGDEANCPWTNEAQTPPIANPDYAGLDENTAHTIDVTANDQQTDSDTFTIDSFTQGTHGTVTQNGNSLVYTPNTDYVGTDQFSYTICDNDGCSTTTVSLWVNEAGNGGGNTEVPPVANTDYAGVNQNSSGHYLYVTTNDQETNGDAFNLDSYTQPAHGTVTQNGDILVYVPDTDYIGTDEFTYTICDNDGCSTATVFLWINEPEPIQQYPPIANNDYVTIDLNETMVINVTANDQQTDGDTFDLDSFTQAAHGTVTQYNGQLIYTPTNGYSGNDQFTYTICDNDGCSTATVYITIESGCNNPNNICIGQFPENTDFCINFCNVPDAVITDWSTTYNCSVILLGNNCVQYTPLPGYYGTDHVTLIGCNSNNQCDTVVVAVIVSTTGCASQETPPIANADYVEASGTAPLTINATGNDIETDNDDFTIDSFTQPNNGIVTLLNGQFVYIADDNFTGEDTFTYTICDNDGCSTATVHVYVQGVQQQSPPVANNDYVSAEGTTPLTINVTGNDQQTDGDSFTIDSYTQANNGTVTLVNGQLVYTANEGFEGEDTFTYTICDNDGCSTATVHVYVQEEPQPPICGNPTFICLNAFPATQTVCVNFCNVNDAVIVDSDTYFHCSVQILSDSCVQYTPLPGFTNATDTLQIYGCNAAGQCDTVTILMHVGIADCGIATNNPPIAIDDHYTTPENTPITINATSNDSDADGDVISITTFTQPQNGTVTLTAGQFTYTPDNGFTGTDQFEYQICDADGLCDIATVYITVENVCNDTQLICAEPLQPITICANFCDLEGTNGVHIVETSTTFNCSIALLNDTCVQYTALPGYNGHDTLVVVACNGAGLCDTSYIYLFVGCAAPLAVDDHFTTNQSGGTLDVLDNDFIACAEEVEVTVVDQPQHGEVIVTASGEVIYVPDTDYIGTDEFSYQVCNTCDLEEACDVATVTVTVTDGGEPTITVDAQPDVVQTSFNTAVTISVLSNDLGVNLTVTEVTQPLHGTVVINEDGTITYTPTTGTYGPDYFFYTVCDAQGNCDQTLVSVTVLEEGAPNNPPNAGNDITVTATNEPITINVLANDSDPEGGNLTVMVVLTEGTQGTVVINPDGTITYTPPTDFVGVDTFAYIVCDDAIPMACDTAIVGVAVGLDEYPNQYPVAAEDAAVTDQGEPITIDVLANDSDPDGDDLTVSIISFPVNGTAVVNPDGTITYEPYPDFQGADYIAYTVCDNGTPSLCDTAYVTIQVGTGNLPPIAVDDTVNTTPSTPIEIDVLANDSDPNGDDLIIVAIIDQPIHGEAIIAIDGMSIGYIPFVATDAPTVDSFTYIVCETFFGGTCDTATVYIYLSPDLNLQPDIAYTNQDNPIEINVLDNDFGCELTISGASNPENGTVEFDANGVIVYTPDAGFAGTDYFYYQACDCAGNCDESLVAVHVLADSTGNLAPIAANDVAITDGDTPITINVLGNDVDPNGDPLTVTAIIDPENGTVVINTDGTVTYTPDEGFVGCDLFGYVVCDNATPVLCDTAFVVVEVGTSSCANQAPVADNETVTVFVDTPTTIIVLEGDTDPDGDDLLIISFTEPLHGDLELDTLTGSFTYTPDEGYEGNDQFTYIVCDNGNPVLCDTAYVNISVQVDTTNNNIVDAQPDVVYTATDQPITIDVLANDLGDNISITNIVTQPINGGSVGITTNGISYIPATGFVGTDYFEYEICDNEGNCDITLVTIYVLPADSTNVAPNANNDVAATPMDTPVCVDVLNNDTDGFGGDTLTITDFTQADVGTVSYDEATNQLCFTPPTGFMGTVEFGYTVCDNGNPVLCDSAMVVITVGLGEVSNNAPIAIDDDYTIPMNSTFNIDVVTPNDTDPDGDSLTITFVSDPLGTVTIIDNHSISYITPTGFTGTDFFYYVLCDNGNPVLCDTAYVTITVLPELEEVVANPDIDYTSVNVPVITHPMDNDSGSNITITFVGTPINGGSVVNNGTSVTYTPAPGFIGTDAYIYTICDNLNNCDTSLVTIVVLDPTTTNIPPVAVNDVTMTDTDTPLCINVLYNDFDAYGGDVIFINFYEQTSLNGGTITQQSDSILCYTPPAGFVGNDMFMYVICDNGNPIMCDTAYVAIGVGTGQLPNRPPVAQDDVEQTYTNMPVTIDILSNDSDPDGDDISIVLLTDPLGTVEIVGGSVLYTPPTGFEGTDYFAYIICDNGVPVLCDTAYVTIDVLPFNPDTTIVTPEDTPDTLCIATIAGTEMPVTSITVLQSPANGTIDFTTDSDSCLIYIPNPNYCGTDAFVIQVCDSMNMCDTLLIGVTIECVEELPIAVNDTVSTNVGETIDIWVLENDYDPDGDPIVVVTIVTPPSNGTVAILNDSTIVYTPNEDFFGEDSLQYVINDNDGSDTAWVFISVDLDPNDVLAINDSVTTEQETPITIGVLGNDIYPIGTTVITIVTQPSNGTVAITADGDSIIYVPSVGFVGTDSFQYELCVTIAATSEVICDTATVYVTVTENEVPLACEPVFANAFSPNGDATNELWLIENADNLSECYPDQEIHPELMIFNRWGDKVYHQIDYDNNDAWNGKAYNNGEDLPDGTYFYIFRISETTAKEDMHQGFIELRR